MNVRARESYGDTCRRSPVDKLSVEPHAKVRCLHKCLGPCMTTVSEDSAIVEVVANLTLGEAGNQT
eukprot:1528911-Amphidinium_carterae.1